MFSVSGKHGNEEDDMYELPVDLLDDVCAVCYLPLRHEGECGSPESEAWYEEHGEEEDEEL